MISKQIGAVELISKRNGSMEIWRNQEGVSGGWLGTIEGAVELISKQTGAEGGHRGRQQREVTGGREEGGEGVRVKT